MIYSKFANLTCPRTGDLYRVFVYWWYLPSFVRTYRQNFGVLRDVIPNIKIAVDAILLSLLVPFLSFLSQYFYLNGHQILKQLNGSSPAIFTKFIFKAPTNWPLPTIHITHYISWHIIQKSVPWVLTASISWVLLSSVRWLGWSLSRRHLSQRANYRVGILNVLAVRIIDSTGDAPTKSESKSETDIFDDSFNLVSWFVVLILIEYTDEHIRVCYGIFMHLTRSILSSKIGQFRRSMLKGSVGFQSCYCRCSGEWGHWCQSI